MAKLDNEMTLNIKVGLDVDNATMDMCMQLISIHARKHGIKGLLLRFYECDNNPSMLPLMTEKDVEKHMCLRNEEE